MKSTHIRSICATLLLAFFLVGVHAPASSETTSFRRNRIVGVWDVQVAVLDCNSGTQIAGFKGLHKYELGGTAQIVPSTNPANLSAHVGVWRHLGKNQYRLEFKMFRFDPAGNNVGWSVAKNDVEINESGTEYTGSGQVDVFDSNGNAVAKSCPVFAGTRF